MHLHDLVPARLAHALHSHHCPTRITTKMTITVAVIRRMRPLFVPRLATPRAGHD